MLIEQLIDKFSIYGVVLFFVGSSFFVIFFILAMVQKMQKRQLESLTTALGAELKASLLGGVHISSFNTGVETQIRIVQGGKNT